MIQFKKISKYLTEFEGSSLPFLGHLFQGEELLDHIEGKHICKSDIVVDQMPPPRQPIQIPILVNGEATNEPFRFSFTQENSNLDQKTT